MKKSDLKNGMVVELRNGIRYMFILEIDMFIGRIIGDDLSSYNYDLTHMHDREYDIVKIFKPTKNGRFSEIISKSHELVWERKEVEKETLTQEQHDKLKALLILGYSWIVRDKGGKICSYNSKPVKSNMDWFCSGDLLRITTFDIPFIKWEEDEPRIIEDLLKLEIKGE